MKQLTLITALGPGPKGQNLVLQLVDFLSGRDDCRYQPEAVAVRKGFSGQGLGAIHLVLTQDREVLDTFTALNDQLANEYPALRVYPIRLTCEDISCAHDDDAMREIVYDSVKGLAADELIISSGGRKTLTSRMIEAGLLYGCKGYLSITAPRGKENREETEHFNVLWTSSRDLVLERQQSLIKDTPGDNFRSLYLLPLAMIDRLRQERIGTDPAQAADDLAWLRRLPKADLHCHLGGAYDMALLKEMAAALLDDLAVAPERRAAIRRHIERVTEVPLTALDAKTLRRRPNQEKDNPDHCLNNLEALFTGLDDKHICTAVLVESLSLAQLEEISRDGYDKMEEWPQDLDWYMACGNLGGSALLQTAGNLRHNLGWLMEKSRREHVRLLEVRFSPVNYTQAGLTVPQVIETLLDEAHQYMASHEGLQVNFLIMATRHKDRAAMEAHVAAAVTFGRPGSGTSPRITGFDLAGKEEGNPPGMFKKVFMPLHHQFMNITIHAGEMDEDDKIWQAMYLLHARRIGHGLKLINHRKMMDYIRDHGIAIEMCPSSNAQTNHFRHFDRDKQAGNEYPLHTYFTHGIPVTINTDNLGISDTDLSREYLQAARLTEGGLSRWDTLRLVKNAFKSAFQPKDEKDRLLKEVDRRIFELVLDDFFPEGRS